MGCAPGTQKTSLQIISGIGLVASILWIVLGIFALASGSQPDPKVDSGAVQIVAWTLIVTGFLSLFFYIFGFHSVAKENATRVKAYGYMHVILIVIGVFSVISKPSGISIISIIVSGVAAYLSFELSKHFENGRPNVINTI